MQFIKCFRSTSCGTRYHYIILPSSIFTTNNCIGSVSLIKSSNLKKVRGKKAAEDPKISKESLKPTQTSRNKFKNFRHFTEKISVIRPRKPQDPEESPNRCRINLT